MSYGLSFKLFKAVIFLLHFFIFLFFYFLFLFIFYNYTPFSTYPYLLKNINDNFIYFIKIYLLKKRDYKT